MLVCAMNTPSVEFRLGRKSESPEAAFSSDTILNMQGRDDFLFFPS